MSGAFTHTSVLLDEVLRVMAPANGKTYIDATFGRGGYSKAILAASANCRVVAVDRDPDAVAVGRALEAEHPDRFKIVEAKFSEIGDVARSLGLEGVDGVAMDIGVSSAHLDDAARGFSFQKDAALDMRMSKEGVTAADVVNSSSETDLANIIYQYGEERRSRRIAKEIVKQRSAGPIETTLQLAGLVERVVGAPRQSRRTHPATKTFQALRIFVNDEIHELAFGLSGAEHILIEGGCLAVVTFHSIEDRLTKQFLAIRSGYTSAVSRHQPPVADARAPSFSTLSRRAVKPSNDEIAANPRARSAKLRWAERTGAPSFDLNLDELGLGNLPNRRAA